MSWTEVDVKLAKFVPRRFNVANFGNEMCGGGNGFSSKSLPDRSNTCNVSLAAAANIPQSIQDTLADGISKWTVLFGMDEKKS